MHHALLADVGVPMIFVEWPLMFCALVPVIIIETLVLRRQLSLPFGRSLAGAARANVLSTLIGVPIAWAFMLAVEFAALSPIMWAAQKWHWNTESPLFYIFYLVGIAWIGPPTTSFWPIALAAALLLVPTFFISVWIERRSYRCSWRDLDPAAVDHSAWLANLCSYALLFAISCGWLGWEIYHGGERAPLVKRMIQEQPIDFVYLHEGVMPSCDTRCQPKFAAVVAQLETCLTDVEGMMRSVEQGNIPVQKNLSSGSWESIVNTNDSWTFIAYTDKLGPVRSVQKHPRNGPARYIFEFNPAGYITRVDLPLDGFDFDDKGRLEHWHGDKCDCWGHPDK
jgi:hypothetical protein